MSNANNNHKLIDLMRNHKKGKIITSRSQARESLDQQQKVLRMKRLVIGNRNNQPNSNAVLNRVRARSARVHNPNRLELANRARNNNTLGNKSLPNRRRNNKTALVQLAAAKRVTNKRVLANRTSVARTRNNRLRNKAAPKSRPVVAKRVKYNTPEEARAVLVNRARKINAAVKENRVNRPAVNKVVRVQRKAVV